MGVRDGIITKDELNLILILDNSYSMVNGRIAQLNSAIPTLKNSLIKVARENNVDLKIRIIAFSDEAKWVIGSEKEGADIETITWKDLTVVGGTATNKAIRAVNKALSKKNLGGDHILPPVVILVTDGNCNREDHDDYLKAIEELKKRLAGNTGKEKVTRIAIGVEGYNRTELEEFASVGRIADVEQPLIFDVDKATDLGKVINWVTVTSIISSIAEEEDIIDLGDPDWGDDEDDDDSIK
ncbi:MAG: VWA domain-containing protein [Solobacterium sp.]|nr:VWA domain-containing protein [Solobacterium sp.]